VEERHGDSIWFLREQGYEVNLVGFRPERDIGGEVGEGVHVGFALSPMLEV
jgi:hypothetical protein